MDPVNLPDAAPMSVNRFEDKDEKGEIQTTGDNLEQFRDLIAGLYQAFKDKNIMEMLTYYDSKLVQVTDLHYKNQSWPTVETIKNVGEDENEFQLFMVLYREMYYRHLYAECAKEVTFDDRVESFQNYFNLFNYILNADDTFDLPNQWIWDLVDEFIYQYNDFTRYCAKLATQKNRAGDHTATPDDGRSVHEAIQFVQSSPMIWNTTYVLKTLNDLAHKSDILTILEADSRASGGVSTTPTSEITEKGPKHLLRMLGYYSLIGSLRVHTILGDYYSALKSIDLIDWHRREKIYSKVVSCNITLHYYTGFVFMMTKRYADVIKLYTALLTHITHIKNLAGRSYQRDDIQKKSEHMLCILAITLSLCPQRIDELILTLLRDKHAEKMSRLSQGDEACYIDMFKQAAPKFIPPAVDFSDETIAPQDALELQKNMFMLEVQQQLILPTIRTYLSLYSTITVEKLASFMSAEGRPLEPNQFRTYLLQLKHKTRQLVWTGAKPSDADRLLPTDIDFVINKDMVHVSTNPNLKQQQNHAQFFIEEIRHLNSLWEDLTVSGKYAQ